MILSSAVNLIFHYFPLLSATQQQQFQDLAPIYTRWNARLNLISRQDLGHLYLRHVLHSLSIAQVIPFQPGTTLLDVGTGGGFPGIPLAILFPAVQFHLIDSIGKKIQAVQHIVTELALSNVTTGQLRAEAIRGEYDFILGRGVTHLSTLYAWVKDKIAVGAHNNLPNGILYLQGQGPVDVPCSTSTYPLRLFFKEPWFETKQLVHAYPATPARS